MSSSDRQCDHHGELGGGISLPVGQLVLTVAVLQLLPFAVGLALGKWAAETAARWRGPALQISNLTLVAVLALSAAGRRARRVGARGRARVEQPVGGVAPPADHARCGRAEQPVGDLCRGEPGIGTEQQRRRACDVRGGHRGARQLLRRGVAGVPVGDDVDTRREEVDARPAVGERRPPVIAVGRGNGQRGGFAGGGGVAGVLVLVARRDGHGQASCGRCCTARTSPASRPGGPTTRTEM